MVPRAIQSKLAGLRGRERLLQLAWGGARWLAIVLLSLLLAGVIDWFCDREQDTPWSVRYLLFCAQIVVAVVGAGWLLLWPLRNRLDDDALALAVEDRYPELGHRLISAVQLNAPGADTEGMSPELIGVVTRQADKQAEDLNFVGVADHRRLKWSLLTAGPALVLFALPFLIWPGLAFALLSRQFLADEDIPHSLTMEALRPEDVWPSGETGSLRFLVRGPDLDSNWAGQVTVRAQGQRTERLPLTFESSNARDEAIFSTLVPAGSTDFSYTARLDDGRLRPGRVHFEPRPIVTDIVAWVVLPKFCGVDADGRPYEQLQARGDIVGIAGSSARVVLKLQKPIESARIETYGPREVAGLPDEASPEILKRVISFQPETLTFKDNEGKEETLQVAQGTFDLRADETAYRAVVSDKYGFANQVPPRRKIRLVDEEAPQVTLLREQFPPSSGLVPDDLSEDYEIEGLPVPFGKDIRIAYIARGPYGLGRARLLYRVVKKALSGNDEVGPNPWIALPLQEVAARPNAGPFNPRLGVFQNSGLKEQIFFHAVADPAPVLPRSLGGGRFDFKTTGIPDGAGGYLKLQVGDQIEYCIEIFADKDAKANRPSNRSDARVKTVVSEGDFALWVSDTIQEERRLRQLDAKQRGLFDDKSP